MATPTPTANDGDYRDIDRTSDTLSHAPWNVDVLWLCDLHHHRPISENRSNEMYWKGPAAHHAIFAKDWNGSTFLSVQSFLRIADKAPQLFD